MHDQNLQWHKLEITSEIANLQAIQRAHGMELMMGGHVGLARVMGIDEKIGAEVSKATVYVCFDCHIKFPLAAIIEHVPENLWREGVDAKAARLRLEAQSENQST